MVLKFFCAILILCFPLFTKIGNAWSHPTIIENVRGYTLVAGGLLRFDALAFDSAGKVISVGKAAELLADSSLATRIDGKGNVLLPGLTDAHGHIKWLGESLRSIDLSRAQTLGSAQEAISEFARARPGETWLTGSGWNQVVWELGRFPTAAEIDTVVSDRPVWLTRVDAHAGWANTKAMQLAGITKKTPDPKRGRIERDVQGAPTGVLVDAAMALVTSIIPKLSERDREVELQSALEHLSAQGLTSVHDAGIDSQTFSILSRFADQGRLPLRVYGMIGGIGEDFQAFSKRGPLVGYGDDRLTVRSVKLYADGALGSRGASLFTGYSDDPANKGLLFDSQQEMQNKIETALKSGFQVNVHGIGDAAISQVLDSFEYAFANVGGRELRNRIEHSQVIAMPDIARFVDLDLIASMQPIHATSDMNMAEDRIGTERIKGAYAWRSLLNQGTKVAAGSDFPVESSNPFYGLHAAVVRANQNGIPIGGWYPEQAMTLLEAFRAFTLDAAYAGHQETTQGSLEPGKWADFILIDQDIFHVSPAQLWRTRVLQTWVGGKQVYQSSD
ncbi:amidohydrolase [Pseudomonas sp. KBW05]|jgi:predicted amidohydrolase YtcJ|uniref:amidohydrolase n=1 Tax=Pseudomonas sp. KBW05 TaxID=2153360 RepID=UPI000F5A4505|nr:amidohydrolase [Pseudomonas sp. KBW05]RQO47863.1 amidohydrolase [Pseudomonas sp. KBW05]